MIDDVILNFWRDLLTEMRADTTFVDQRSKRDSRRQQVRPEITKLLNDFLRHRIDIEEFRAAFDRKTRSDWDVFGLKGLSGAMFLNQLVKHIDDTQTLTAQLQQALALPTSVEDGRERMEAFQNYLDELIEAGDAQRRHLQPARLPFLLSAMWHMQDPEMWPPYYISGRRAFEQEGVYEPVDDPVEDYFRFRQAFLELASALNLQPWWLEHLAVWYHERSALPDVEGPEAAEPAAIPAVQAARADAPVVISEEAAREQDEFTHAQVQWMLARIGKKLGCNVWIAANDRRKVWNGELLGDYSINQLPLLGFDMNSQRIIELIDVVWLKGMNSIVAAFEVEHTTSVYSGLLRMADLMALSPNINFPLYIVTSERRLSKVKNELSRPTFQVLELHRRCGFFAYEDLMAQADHIMRWATSPSAIARLAQRVGDIDGEGL